MKPMSNLLAPPSSLIAIFRLPILSMAPQLKEVSFSKTVATSVECALLTTLQRSPIKIKLTCGTQQVKLNSKTEFTSKEEAEKILLESKALKKDGIVSSSASWLLWLSLPFTCTLWLTSQLISPTLLLDSLTLFGFPVLPLACIWDW